MPRYARRTREVDEAILGTYLSDANSRRIRKALKPLLGEEHLSKSAVSRVVSRLKERFEEWQTRALSEEVYAIVYLDGFHLKVRMAKRVISVPVLSKNINELKTGAPGRFDRHHPVASPRSGACRRRCRRFGFSARAGKTPSSNGMLRSLGEDLDPGPGQRWTLRRPGPHLDQNVLGQLRGSSPGLDSEPLGRPLFPPPAWPGQRPLPNLAQTWHSKIEIRDPYRK